MKKRQYRLDRIDAIAREYQAARLAVTMLNKTIAADSGSLKKERLTPADAQNVADNLEGTYLLRLFAEFEAGVRHAWVTFFKQSTIPPMRDLIDAVAARRRIPESERANAHLVREYRNSLVHEGDEDVEPIPLKLAKSYLCTFFSRLPPDW